MESKCTKFCTINYRAEDKSVSEIINAIKIAELENKKFFKINPKKYFVDIVYSEKEYDKKANLSGIEMQRGGCVHKNRMILISPEKRKLSFDFKPFFYHEINHIFYNSLIGSYYPIWFSEGIATFLMKSYKIDIPKWKKYFQSIKQPEKYLFYRYQKEKYFKNINEFFPLSYLVSVYLNKNYGEKIIINLLKEFKKNPTKTNFDKLLIKYFKQTKKEIVQISIN